MAQGEIPREVTERIEWLEQQCEDARAVRDDVAAQLKVLQVKFEALGEALDSARYITNVLCGTDL